jgi:hypothetical protein
VKHVFTGVQPQPRKDFIEWGGERLDYTIQLLKRYVPEGSTVLDLASGAHVSFVITRACPTLDWIPTDGQSSQETFTKNGREVYTYNPIPLLLPEGKPTLPEGPYDAITFLETVEHLAWNPAPLFGAINESLRDGGIFMLSTPNIGSRVAMQRQLQSGPPFQIAFFEKGFWYHKKEYSTYEMRELVRWAGFDIVSHTTRNVARNEAPGLRSLILHGALMLASALTLDAKAVRHLIQFSGSTQFLVCRKARAPRWHEPPLPV